MQAGFSLKSLPGTVQTLEVAPLSIPESVELAQKMLTLSVSERVFSEATLEKIGREGGGHPLFVQELVRYAASTYYTDTSSSSLTLDEVLWHRIQELEGLQRQLVEAVCVAGVPLSLQSLAEAIGSRPGDRIRRG